jgi:hypothetical protein
MNATELARFFTKIDKEGKGDCWLWVGELSHNGYGRMWTSEKHPQAHRISFEHFKGSIPKGLVLDHLCRVRNCVNPEHLEVVTVKENTNRGNSPQMRIRRSGICSRGHSMTEDNIRMNGTRRTCRICGNARSARYKARQLALKENS